MKHKYIISTMLALFFCVSSVGCAQAGADDAKTLWETALDSLFAAMSGETDAPEPEEELEEEWDEEWEVDPEEEWEEHPEEEPEEEPGVYMNLDGMTIVAMAPFENGVGWIQYMKGKEMYTAAVRTDGRLLFEIPGAVWYASAFEDGAAYVVVSDNATYYSNADPSLGCYEQVAPASVHEEIYDLRGNLLYSTAWSGSGESHIVCSGEGLYIVLRHESGLEYDRWLLGAIGKDGETVSDFKVYDGINGGLLRTWKGKYSGTRSLPNMYGIGYGNGNAGDQGSGYSRYIGEGAYCLVGSSGSVFYMPGNGVVTKPEGTVLGDCYGGEVLIYRYSSYYTQNVYSGETAPAAPLNAGRRYEDIGNGRIFQYDHLMPNNLYYYDHSYYDIEMERVIDIEKYTSLKMDGSVFNEGYALIFLVGMDGKTYTTVIDDEGTVQFEPILADKTSGKVSDGYFVVRTDTECAVYDIGGNYVRYLCTAMEGEYIRDISGGYVTVWGNGMNKIYDMNPEWER